VVDLSKFDDAQQAMFGPAEEEAIISLILEQPETFVPMARFITSDLFKGMASKYIIDMLREEYDKYGSVPTRPMFRDKAARTLEVDDPYQEILDLIDRVGDPRDLVRIRDRIKDWVQHQTLALLYNEDALDAHARGDYEYLERIFNDASRVSLTADAGFWFFDQYEEILADDAVEHISTGFPRLDILLNEGGPSPKEVVVWLAPTGVGKCHSLQSKIIEKDLSRIFELELENGTIIKLAGFREIQTARGGVKVCDLTEDDIIASIPDMEDAGDIQVPAM